MALSYGLNIEQGLSFTPADKIGVGHLLSATFFGTALAADLMVTDPKTSASIAAVGVLQQVQWAQTPAAPMSMTAFMSGDNHAVLKELLNQAIASSAVVLNFHVEEYDPMASAYYVAFTPAQPPLNALIGKTGSNLQLQIASSPVTVKATALYQVSFTVEPGLPQTQVLTVAPSASAKEAVAWGG